MKDLAQRAGEKAEQIINDLKKFASPGALSELEILEQALILFAQEERNRALDEAVEVMRKSYSYDRHRFCGILNHLMGCNCDFKSKEILDLKYGV